MNPCIPPDCSYCGMPGFELEVLPDEGVAYCPYCGNRTMLDLEGGEAINEEKQQ